MIDMLATLSPSSTQTFQLSVGLAVIVLLLPLSANATEVFRCVAADGSIAFSETPCGPDAQKKSYQGTAPLSGSESPPVSPKQQLRRYQKGVEEIENLIGGDDPKPVTRKKKSYALDCSGVTRLQLRNARVSKNVMKCHTMRDVRSMLGDPDRVETFSDRKRYDTRWTFYFNNGNQRIYFQNKRVSRINTLQDKSN